MQYGGVDGEERDIHLSEKKYSVESLVHTINACIKDFARQTRVYKRDMVGLDALLYGFSLIPGK